MSFTVVIPARHASSRLAGKPLLDIGGKPMLQHVWERARASAAGEVVVATDDERIMAACQAFGARALMTSAGHPSGTDRIEEASRQLGLPADAIVVNVQGDEPLIPPAVIDQVAANLSGAPAAGIATLCEPLATMAELFDPNIVKVVTGGDGMALYFSRAPIPWVRGWGREWTRDVFANAAPGQPAAAPPDVLGDTPAAALAGTSAVEPAAALAGTPSVEVADTPAAALAGTSADTPADPPITAKRHLGIYAYRVGFLRDFVCWPPGKLEQLESLEQLRALENGARIHVAAAAEPVPPGVDTQADLDAVRALVDA